MKIIQIQAVPVPNVYETQCNVFIYALTDTGAVYFMRDNDGSWVEIDNKIMEASNDNEKDT